MTCSLRSLEFYLLWLSTWSAVLIISTVFDPGTLVVDEDGTTLSSEYAIHDESLIELYFAVYAFGISAVCTLAVLLGMHYCSPNKYVRKVGRKRYILIVAQLMKILVTVASVWIIKEGGQMQRRTGNDGKIGIVQWVCEYTSIALELSLNVLEEKSKFGVRVFLKTFAEVTLAQMIAGQLFVIDEITVLYAALAGSLSCCVFLACTIGKDIGWFEDWLLWIGIASGFIQGLIFQRAKFKPRQDVLNYVVLFVLTLILPYVNKKYREVDIPPEYKYSYRKYRKMEEQGDTEVSGSEERALAAL